MVRHKLSRQEAVKDSRAKNDAQLQFRDSPDGAGETLSKGDRFGSIIDFKKMVHLKFTERLQLERLLGMSSGYVLNFSDKTFREFVLDSVRLDIYGPGMDAGGTSKAKRLRHFWSTQPPHLVGRLLLDLCDYYRATESNRNEPLLSECNEIANRLVPSRSPVTAPAAPVAGGRVRGTGSSQSVGEPSKDASIERQSDPLLSRFEAMASCSDAHRRGYLLEDLLVQTFRLHQIEVVRSFRRNSGAEQIDAAFKLEGWHYLVECRWRERLADTRQVDGLSGQVRRAGKQTMGLFLAVNGWSAHVPSTLKQNPDKSVMLMDGFDLRVVLEGRIGLRDLLLAKLSHFNIEGEPFVSVVQILGA